MLFNTSLLNIVLAIPALLIGFTFHEYAHALMADRLGDRTPRFQGRLTLNPISHIDPIGFLLIILVGFGWAKPVQTNPSSYKRYYKDDLKVSIAGPIANIIIAVISTILLIILLQILTVTHASFNSVIDIIYKMLQLVIYWNCLLFFLNLLPIPGFDGFHVLRDLFPKFFYNRAEMLVRYQLIIFIALAAPILPGRTAILDYLITYPTGVIYRTLMKLVALFI